MRQLNAMEHLHDCVGCGIDDIDGVSRAIGDVDERPRLGRRVRVTFCSRTPHPFGNRQPVGIILGLKLVAAGMERIATRFGASGWSNNVLEPGAPGTTCWRMF